MPTATPAITVNRTIDHARRRSIAISWVASMRGPLAGHAAGRLDGEGHTTIWWRRDPTDGSSCADRRIRPRLA